MAREERVVCMLRLVHKVGMVCNESIYHTSGTRGRSTSTSRTTLTTCTTFFIHTTHATLNFVHTSCISGATDTMRNTHTVYNIQCIPQVTEVQCIPCVIPVPSIPQSHSYFALYAYIAFVTRILCVPRL